MALPAMLSKTNRLIGAVCHPEHRSGGSLQCRPPMRLHDLRTTELPAAERADKYRLQPFVADPQASGKEPSLTGGVTKDEMPGLWKTAVAVRHAPRLMRQRDLGKSKKKSFTT